MCGSSFPSSTSLLPPTLPQNRSVNALLAICSELEYNTIFKECLEIIF